MQRVPSKIHLFLEDCRQSYQYLKKIIGRNYSYISTVYILVQPFSISRNVRFKKQSELNTKPLLNFENQMTTGRHFVEKHQNFLRNNIDIHENLSSSYLKQHKERNGFVKECPFAMVDIRPNSTLCFTKRKRFNSVTALFNITFINGCPSKHCIHLILLTCYYIFWLYLVYIFW